MVSHASPKSILFLGSGDFSSPLKAATDLTDKSTLPLKLPSDIRFVATELRTREETQTACQAIAAKNTGESGRKKLKTATEDQTFSSIVANIEGIQNLGGQVIEGFDALKPFNEKLQDQYSIFDRIIFENPHSGFYGGSAIGTNTGLLRDVMRNVRDHLSPSGIFELSICGWPYKNPDYRGDGMDLLGRNEKNGKLKAAEFAAVIHMEYLYTIAKGLQKISRNDGSKFDAEVHTLFFQKADQSAPVKQSSKQSSKQGGRPRAFKL